MNRCGLEVRRYTSRQERLRFDRFGSPFSSKVLVYGHDLVTLPTQLMKHMFRTAARLNAEPSW